MSSNMSSNTLIISCLFGKKFDKTYKAPLYTNCVFFTNNKNLKDEITQNGWTYVYVDFELSDDFIISSLQSKYIKFLIFLEDFSEFKKFTNIIYTDHKFNLLDNHIDKFFEIYNCNKQSSIIIRKTPGNKTNIYDEINDAKSQERYVKSMNETIQLIENKVNLGEINTSIRISNTGIIFYHNYNTILPMLQNIYNSCIQLQQPECQIFWALYSQKYLDHIHQIEFFELNPVWKCP